jgi:uncharacterized protein (DUF433 family)
MPDLLDEPELVAPLYTQREAAALIGVPPTTFRGWARGYAYRAVDGTTRVADPLVTTTGPGRGAVVPFVGLGEAYVLAAFREAGVPMQRIRPAVSWLEEHIGLRAALTSERLRTDGAELLWDFAHASDGPGEPVDDLVVIRNQQIVFRDVIAQYLSTITYRDGRLVAIRLPSFRPEVVLDPWRNFGQPTLARSGVRVQDVRDRLAAGETVVEVATDYGVPLADVEDLAAA